MTRNNIIHGFVENGMIDFDNNRFPYFKHILETFRKDPAVEEYKLCETHFPCLLQKYLDDGHVDDATFEGNGSPVDVDEFGTSVRRTATISQESRQREQNLTHAHQFDLRSGRSENIKAGIQCKKSDHMSVLEARVSNNKYYKDKLQNLMKEDGLDETDFANVLHELLAKIKGGKLKIFILAIKQDVPTSTLLKK